MTIEGEALLLSLQHGDSFFPSGSVAFSHGLETLHQDGCVEGLPALQDFVLDQMEHRWRTLDVGIVRHVWRSHASLDEIMTTDAWLESMTLPNALREGSRRAGAACLTVHESLATPGVAALAECVNAGRTPGHLAVVQGVAWRGAGLRERDCVALSGHTFAVALLGAAIRLGVVGHLGAQKILTGLRSCIGAAMLDVAMDLEDLHGYTPLSDIAAMRHERQGSHLFSN